MKSLNLGNRLIANEGSSRSTKTYSILQLFITLSNYDNFDFECVAHTIPHLKQGALKDFLEILNDNGLYSDNDYNKTDRIYKLNGCTFKFSAYETADKAKGHRRQYLFINEADLISEEIYIQLAIRTTHQIIIDYNPAYDEHWIFDLVDENEDCTLIKSTYKDNPFLSYAQIKEIESLKTRSPLHWKVYGLGQRTSLKEGKIYNNYEVGDFNESVPYLFGLDFGFNDPDALIKVGIDEGKKLIYLEECMYESNQTNDQLRKALKYFCGHDSLIIADSAEKKLIQSLQRKEGNSQKGFNIRSANKGKINERIKLLQSYKFIVTENSVNLQKELRNYIWMDKRSGQPIDAYNHLLDALAYAYLYASIVKRKQFGF